jgi:pimeloyl-ACP methyl ester carboxylesterase
MSILQYWPILEAVVILAVFGAAIFGMWRKVKARAKNPPPRPATLAGRIGAGAMYLLRLAGFFVGVFLAVALVVMIERDIFSVITETAPTPSEVTIPSNLEFEVEEVTFKSEDDLTLAGWYVPPQNGAVIILLHGYGGNRTGMIWHARQLIEAGYGVLMYDERASGESGGTYRSYGWEDTRDVEGAIRFLRARQAEGRAGIGVAGCSTGADIALRGAAMFPELGAVWADGASTVRAQDMPAPKNPITALFVAANYMLDWMYTLKLDIELPAPLTDVLDEIAPRPILLVGGGTKRPIVGSEADLYTLRYAEIAGPNAQAWIIPEATHCNGPRLRPDDYAARMVAFFDAAFGIQR